MKIRKNKEVIGGKSLENPAWLVGWLVGSWRLNFELAIFQSYLDFEGGDNQYLKIQVARLGIEPRSSCSASQELNHSATAAPENPAWRKIDIWTRNACLKKTEIPKFHLI